MWIYKLYLKGHFVRSLGKIGEREAENEVILLEHDVPHSKFSDEVLGCLPKETWTISAAVCIYDYYDLINFLIKKLGTIQNLNLKN